MDILNVLEKATQINSVSGSENEIRKFISDNVKKYCDELSVDAMGNLIAHKSPRPSVRAQLAADKKTAAPKKAAAKRLCSRHIWTRLV